MIEDPIVIRKSRGNLIISAILASDPVQLIRQINMDHIEVHLKNGSKYVEDVNEENLEETILELMGFRKESLAIGFHAWDRSQDCAIDFSALDLPAIQNMVGEQITDAIFSKTPYIHSKFVELKFNGADEEITSFYEGEYGAYDVELVISFWTRVDSLEKIIDHCHDIRSQIAEIIMGNTKRRELTKQKYKRRLDAGYNDFAFYFFPQD